MRTLKSLLLALALPRLSSAETVLGVYIFHRHGDRTSKSTPPTVLTDLGYSEVFARGSYYHSRYIASGSPSQIAGIQEDIVELSQLSVSSPSDNVLQNSATGWLQGLYPPVGSSANQTLRNGSTVDAPLNGYQLIPVSVLSSGSGSENSAWLQGSTGCLKAELSSNEYFSSDSYNSLLASTADFYKSLASMINSTFTPSQMNFKNAYAIFDYLNVAYIHNSTTQYPALDQLTPDLLHQLLVLANIHEWNLAYNASDPVRAIAGAVLAGQVVQFLNQTITSGGQSKLGVQFGSYATFLSYFGLAQLPSVGPQFEGMPDYASSMVWELVTNSTTSSGSFPPASEISVRFLFHNGTSATSAEPTAYPLFGQSNTVLSWSDFVENTNKFAISGQSQWCQACGNTTGTCAGTDDASTSSSLPSAAASSSSSGGISRGVAGVIGAMVTLGVILGVEALILVVGGFRLTRKRAVAAAAGEAVPATAAEKAS
ncbi:hypothetical protein VTN77DRAFT_7056 [Rasamsonia byssochlamydoides]|uniref:uncharacterized protein n=1 Tax=Rasamsonia byssochlamydoides TaxID=89139 RepID=UPI003742B2F2